MIRRPWQPPPEYTEAPPSEAGHATEPKGLAYLDPEAIPAVQATSGSYDELVRRRAEIDTYRVRWPIFGTLADITIPDDACDPTSPARPYQLPDGRVHPIAGALLVDQHVTSQSFRVHVLEASIGLEYECDDDYELCEDAEGDDYWVYLDSDGEDHDDRVRECLCGAYYQIPPDVRVKSKTKNGAITIGDMIRVLHPWFQAHKAEILKWAIWLEEPFTGSPEDTIFYLRDRFASGTLFFWRHDDAAQWYTRGQWRKRAYQAQIETRKLDPNYPQGLTDSQIERDRRFHVANVVSHYQGSETEIVLAEVPMPNVQATLAEE